MVILTIRERATWVLLLTALIFPLAADAQEQKQHAAQYEQYLQGASRVADHFKALYGELGKHVRRSGVLKKCGYKKEADETDARVKALIDQKLTALIERDIDSRQLSSDVAILVAREGAASMLVGYAVGYRESFALTADLFPARTYESMCKENLSKVREWLGEASK